MDSISLLQAPRRLSVVWLIGAVLQFLLLLLQGLGGFWKDTTGLPKVDHTVDAMQWLIANIAPTLTLILGVLVASETQPPVQREFKRQRFDEVEPDSSDLDATAEQNPSPLLVDGKD